MTNTKRKALEQSDWDYDNEAAIGYTPRRSEKRGRRGGAEDPRESPDYLICDDSYELDVCEHAKHPYPKEAEEGVYVGNALHSDVCKVAPGRKEHFAEVVTLYMSGEDHLLSISSLESSHAVSRAGTVHTHVPVRRIRSWSADGGGAYVELIMAARAIERARRPVLVKCLNGGSRANAAVITRMMKANDEPFGKACDRLMKSAGRVVVNRDFAEVCKTHVWSEIQRMLKTTVNADEIFPHRSLEALVDPAQDRPQKKKR